MLTLVNKNMASSKTFLLLGLVCVVLILIFSGASARELAETTAQNNDRGVTLGRGGYNRGGKGGHGSEHDPYSRGVPVTNGRGGYNRGGGKVGHGPEHDPYSRGVPVTNGRGGYNRKPAGPGTAETETKN